MLTRIQRKSVFFWTLRQRIKPQKTPKTSNYTQLEANIYQPKALSLLFYLTSRIWTYSERRTKYSTKQLQLCTYLCMTVHTGRSMASDRGRGIEVRQHKPTDYSVSKLRREEEETDRKITIITSDKKIFISIT